MIKKLVFSIALLLATSLIVSGCGRKGDPVAPQSYNNKNSAITLAITIKANKNSLL